MSQGLRKFHWRVETKMAKILLAEDDDSLRGFLVSALKKAGHIVKDYSEGDEALKSLEQEVFDGLDPVEDEEMDMLDLAFGLEDTSRLGCQIKVTKELEGKKITLPSERF